MTICGQFERTHFDSEYTNYSESSNSPEVKNKQKSKLNLGRKEQLEAAMTAAAAVAVARPAENREQHKSRNFIIFYDLWICAESVFWRLNANCANTHPFGCAVVAAAATIVS